MEDFCYRRFLCCLVILYFLASFKIRTDSASIPTNDDDDEATKQQFCKTKHEEPKKDFSSGPESF